MYVILDVASAERISSETPGLTKKTNVYRRVCRYCDRLLMIRLQRCFIIVLPDNAVYTQGNYQKQFHDNHDAIVK
jgi:hypothetical protein